MLLLGVIDPVAFRLGPIPVHWYGIIFVAAIMAAVWVTTRGARMRGLDPEFVPDLSTFAVISGIIGARLYEVFVLQWDNVGWYLAHPIEIVATWKGGLAIHGGVIGALLVGGLYMWRRKQPFWRWADVVAPGLILAQGIGRWGNFMNQEAYGSPAPESLIARMPGWLREGMTIEGVVHHPTFLYESIWNVLVFIVLYAYNKRKPPTATVFGLYFVLYNVGRFAIESIRLDSSFVGGSFRIAQLMAILQIVVGAGLMLWGYRRSRRQSVEG